MDVKLLGQRRRRWTNINPTLNQRKAGIKTTLCQRFASTESVVRLLQEASLISMSLFLFCFNRHRICTGVTQ